MERLLLYIVLKFAYTFAVSVYYTTNYKHESGDYFLKESAPVEMVCDLNGRNPQEIDYIRWTQAITSKSSQIYHSKLQESDAELGYLESQWNPNGHTLTIRSFSAERDIGIYSCVVCDKFSQCQTGSMMLKQEMLIVLPSVFLEISSSQIREGDSFWIKCHIQGGYPDFQPYFEWAFKSLYQSIPDRIYKEEDEIVVAHVDVSFYGSFTCFVKVFGGMVYNTTHLEVQYSPYIIMRPSNEEVLQSIGSSMKLNCTLRSLNISSTNAWWEFVPHGGNKTEFLEKAITLTTVDPLQHLYMTSLKIDNLRMSHFGKYFCKVSSITSAKRHNIFEVTLDVPTIIQDSLVYSKHGNDVTLTWATPIGIYTSITIKQCMRNDICTNHTVSSAKDTMFILREEDSVQYTYYMVLYQYDVMVLKSEPFQFNQGGSDSYLGVIAGVTTVGVLLLVVMVPCVVVTIIHCRCKQSKEGQNGCFVNVMNKMRCKKKMIEKQADLTDINEENDNHKDSTVASTTESSYVAQSPKLKSVQFTDEKPMSNTNFPRFIAPRDINKLDLEVPDFLKPQGDAEDISKDPIKEEIKTAMEKDLDVHRHDHSDAHRFNNKYSNVVVDETIKEKVNNRYKENPVLHEENVQKFDNHKGHLDESAMSPLGSDIKCQEIANLDNANAMKSNMNYNAGRLDGHGEIHGNEKDMKQGEDMEALERPGSYYYESDSSDNDDCRKKGNLPNDDSIEIVSWKYEEVYEI